MVGNLDLPYESFPLVADLSQSLLTYTAEPGSPTQDALTLLASWASTTGGAELAAPTDSSEQTESFGRADYGAHQTRAADLCAM